MTVSTTLESITMPGSSNTCYELRDERFPGNEGLIAEVHINPDDGIDRPTEVSVLTRRADGEYDITFVGTFRDEMLAQENLEGILEVALNPTGVAIDALEKALNRPRTRSSFL